MVKRRKTTAGLASLRQRQRDPDYEEPIHFDPHRPLPPNWKMPRPPARPPARPRLDPADLRTERHAMRMHPDLRDEIFTLARQRGWKASQWMEKALIEAVNSEHGREVLDQIGRRQTKAKP